PASCVEPRVSDQSLLRLKAECAYQMHPEMLTVWLAELVHCKVASPRTGFPLALSTLCTSTSPAVESIPRSPIVLAHNGRKPGACDPGAQAPPNAGSGPKLVDRQQMLT